MTQPRIQQLHQSGAALGQAAVWDGTTWVPARQAIGVDDPGVFDGIWGATPLGADLEFDADTVSLPSGWSWVNQGDSAYEQMDGVANVYAASSGGSTTATETHRMLVRAIPSESAWRAFLHVNGIGGAGEANVRWGLVMRESGSGKYLTWCVTLAGGWPQLQLVEWSATNTLATTLTDLPPATAGVKYLEIRKDSGSSWRFFSSDDGIVWTPWWFGYDPAGFTGGAVTFDQIGFFFGVPDTSSSGGVDASAEWFRIR